MKIVVVLCSLATFAIAVPVSQENIFESSLNNQASSTKRERTLVFPDTNGLLPENGIEKIPIHSIKKSSQGTSVEAKSFRRPIIIKRKLGYHVYRDSDEEMAYAEPGEKCREQVKFKLCDHEPVSSSKNGFKSPTFKCFNNHNTDNEMGNSIKMAKEAVEHLQKDLKRMESFSPKIANTHIEDIESNAGLHHDIEIAREALEHIEQNFESVNSEVNKVNELQIPKLQDEERLTRWREAIENIHKNFEIVKNIEDAFKSDNHFSLFRSDSRKTVESEKPEHSEGHVYVQHKFTNNNLESNDEAYNEDKILKSASNEDGIAQLTPKTENGVNIGNDMFVSPTSYKEENIRLHSDSLKSDINNRDTFLRSAVSEIESTIHDSGVRKESIEYVPKKSLSEAPSYSEHEKAVNDQISDDYELLPTVSSSLSDSLDKNIPIEEPKTMDKTELMMKTALPERDNRNSLIKMKSVKEILGNKKDQDKAATSNEENINEYEELFKFKNENSPLERLSLLPSTNIKETSTNIKTSKNSDAGGEEKIYSDKYNDKDVENNEHQSESYNTNMRLSNDQLDKTEKLSADKLVTIDQDLLQSSNLFSLKGKNVLVGEENVQNEHKTHHTIKENYEFHDSQRGSEKEVKDDTQHFKRTDEYKNMKSSEVQDGKIDSQIIQNQESNKFSFLNDDSVMKVNKKVPGLYKTVSQASDEHILNDRYFENQHSIEEEMRISTQNKDANEDSKLQFSKSVLELYSDPMLSTPIVKFDISDDQHSHTNEMRLSQTQNEKLHLNEHHEGDEHASTRFNDENNSDDTKTQSFKSISELKPNPIASLPTDIVEITNNQQSHRKEASMRSPESQNEKMHSNENQRLHEPLPIGLDIERHAEERSWQSSKSVPELPSNPIVSVLTEKVDIIDDQHDHEEEASMKSAESPNEKKQLDEIQGVYEPLMMSFDIERLPEERTWLLSKSAPELPYDPMVSMATEKVDITDDHHAHKEEASMRSSESESEKSQLNKYQDGSEQASTKLEIENSSDDIKSQIFKSVSELESHPLALFHTDKIDITNNRHVQEEEMSMRSVEVQNENNLSNENQKVHELLGTGLDIERHPEERSWQFSKSVPELPYDPMVSIPTEKKYITDDHRAHKGEASMRSSESQSEKLELNGYQNEPEHASTKLEIENNSDEMKSQFLKSVPELPYDSTVSMPTEKLVITDDRHAHKEEASMRSSESQSEKLELNDYQDEPKLASTKPEIENNSDEMKSQFLKSVPELPYESMVSKPTEKVDITDDHHAHKEEASMRSSESQSEKLELNEYQNEPEHALTKLEIENNPDEMKSQFLKSVPELPYDPMVSMPTEKVDITDDRHAHKEEASMRSSESQSEKLELNEYQVESKHASTKSDIENISDDSESQVLKSVPELPYDSMVSKPTEEVDITDEHHAYKEEASMRSSESQSEKLQLNEYQVEPKHASTKSDIENISDDSESQVLKSVPELPYDSMVSKPTEKVDITEDHHAHKEEASMRSSESQSEKLELNEYQVESKHASTKSDIENISDDSESQVLKSVPELPYDSMVSKLTEKVDITDDHHAHKEEASMRSSESQSEKLELNEYQVEPKHASTKLDIENISDDSESQVLKSVPELPYDSMVSKPTEKVDITDDHLAHKEEASMRSSESQSEKLQLNEYQDEPRHASTKTDIENNSDDVKSHSFKSVPELPYDSMVSMPTSKVDITDDRHAHKEEASMRSSESQSEKLQLNEYQDEPRHASTKTDIENNSDDVKSHSFKSVPELPYDSMVSMPTSKVDITDDRHAHKEEASMRSSESQSKKLELNEYQDEPKLASTKPEIENNSDEMKSHFLKSVPELSYDSMVSKPTEKFDITDDHHAHKEEASMRTSESQSEKLELNEYQDEPKLASTKPEIENNSDNVKFQFSKSVPELETYPTASFPTYKVDIINNRPLQGEEESMRSAEGQNEKNQETHELLPLGLDIKRHPEERTWQISTSESNLLYDPMISMLTENVDIPKDHYSSTGDASMKVSEAQNEKLLLNEYGNGPEHSLTKLGKENNVHNQKPLFFKSVPELHTDPIISLPIDNVHINNEQYSHAEEVNMRLTQTQNEKLQLNDFQERHEPLMMRLDMTNNPEDRKWQIAKSVPELPFDPMISMPTDKVEITNDQKSLKEGNMRFSQNQNEETQFHESHGLQDFFPNKLGIENHPDLTSQSFKSAPELYMTRSNINHVNNENFYFPEDARLSQIQNERQQLYFNQHLYEPLSTRTANEKKLEDESLTANKVRFSNIQNPMKEETNMRLSQNQNENKEIQYTSRSNEHMNRKENSEHIMNDFIHLSETQHEQLHENRNPMLRLSNERQHFKSWPEPLTSQFEFSNGQNVLNDHMRTNQQQSRDPEPMENRNLHNSLSMRWNIDNQHQEPSSKTFKFNSDFGHTLYKSNEFDNEQFIPHEVSKTANTLEYHTRPQLYGDHIWDDTQSNRWYQTQQHNDHFANYYKTIPEGHEEYINPHFRKHLHRVDLNHNLNDADTFSSHDSPSNRARLHEHMQKYHQEKSSNMDSTMDPNMHFNHPHGTARFGAGLPIAGVNSGAMGVFPTANAGGCGIPLLLSCSPSVVSGSLARSHIAGPIFKSVDDNFKYYMKRDAKNIADIPENMIQKASFPHNHQTGTTSEIQSNRKI